MKTILILNKKLESAQENLANELTKKFPKGHILYFHISSKQKNPSQGIIMGADQNRFAGYVRVRMISEKEDVKSVHFSQIIGVKP